jgi:hypothetical protein
MQEQAPNQQQITGHECRRLPCSGVIQGCGRPVHNHTAGSGLRVLCTSCTMLGAVWMVPLPVILSWACVHVLPQPVQIAAIQA